MRKKIEILRNHGHGKLTEVDACAEELVALDEDRRDVDAAHRWPRHAGEAVGILFVLLLEEHALVQMELPAVLVPPHSDVWHGRHGTR